MFGDCVVEARLRVLVATAVALACFALPASAAAQVEPTPTTGLVLPDESVTTRADAISLELNPAGLGFIRNSEAAVGFQRATGDFEGLEPEGTGVFLAGGNGTIGAGFGAQWLERPDLAVELSDYRKYTLGLAVSSEENFSFGAAYNFFGSSDSALLDDLASWDVGMMWRPSANLGFGVRARDLNQAFLHDHSALPVRTAIGVALRFFGGRMLLDPTFEFTSDGDSILLRPRVLFEPVDGVRVFGRAEWDLEFENDQSTATWTQTVLGLALNSTVFGLESAAIADFGDASHFLGHTHLAWISEGKRRGFGGELRRWVLVDLTGGIAEQPVSGLFGPSASSFMSLLVQLEDLSKDDSVEGVVFNVGNSGLGYAQIWEIRQAINTLRQAGKETVTVLTNPTFRETYLGSVTEHVWLIPAEPYSPGGLSLNLTSYAETLAKAGIQAEFLRIGRYKTAPETYTYRQPSHEAIEQITRYLDGLFGRTVQALANDVDMEVDEIKEMIDRVPLFPAQAAEEGFVDEIVYLDNIEERLRDKFGRHVSLERKYPEVKSAEQRWGTRPEVAVVVIEGSIVRGRSGRTPFINEVIAGSDTLTQIFDKLRRDPMVRAVVVRIDSPGGSAVGSDLIYREMRRLAEKKPVVASMGNVAASGGYYVAAGADEIFASPNTLTGSIGIFTGKISISKLADLIGLNSTNIERGERSGAFDIYRPWTEEEREGVARSITYLYKLFIQQVARTRPLSPDAVDAVGRGRIWDGVSAEQEKLVDQIGGLMDAVRRAEELAGVGHGELAYELYPEAVGLFDASNTSVTAKLARKLLGQQQPAALPADSALGTIVRRIGKGVLLPALYEDGEALMLLPYVVDLE